jgi:hypothetical protein
LYNGDAGVAGIAVDTEVVRDADVALQEVVERADGDGRLAVAVPLVERGREEVAVLLGGDLERGRLLGLHGLEVHAGDELHVTEPLGAVERHQLARAGDVVGAEHAEDVEVDAVAAEHVDAAHDQVEAAAPRLRAALLVV